MADNSGMLMFFMMFVAIAAGLYFLRDRLQGIFGAQTPPPGEGEGEGEPTEEMPPEEDTPGVFTKDLVECARRCEDCDNVIDPNSGQVYWHAARSDDEKDCFECLKDKCKFLYPENKTIIKKYYETKNVTRNINVTRPENREEGDRPSREKSPRSGSGSEESAYARAMLARRRYW